MLFPYWVEHLIRAGEVGAEVGRWVGAVGALVRTGARVGAREGFTVGIRVGGLLTDRVVTGYLLIAPCWVMIVFCLPNAWEFVESEVFGVTDTAIVPEQADSPKQPSTR